MNIVRALTVVNLAHPHGGPPLGAGTYADVDSDDEWTKAQFNAGYLVLDDSHADAPPAVVVTANVPDMSWSREELVEYAGANHQIDVPDGMKKSEIIDAINQAGQPG